MFQCRTGKVQSGAAALAAVVNSGLQLSGGASSRNGGGASAAGNALSAGSGSSSSSSSSSSSFGNGLSPSSSSSRLSTLSGSFNHTNLASALTGLLAAAGMLADAASGNGSSCISRVRICDGIFDCQDHSDESFCQSDCGEHSFKCRSTGRCIPSAWVSCFCDSFPFYLIINLLQPLSTRPKLCDGDQVFISVLQLFPSFSSF